MGSQNIPEDNVGAQYTGTHLDTPQFYSWVIASVLCEVTRLPDINFIWISFFLSSLFLMSCSSRWLLQVLHTVTGRMQHKASVLPVPQRGQRTAGKRHKQFYLSGRKLKWIDWSKGKWTRHISHFCIPFQPFSTAMLVVFSHTQSQISVRTGAS